MFSSVEEALVGEVFGLFPLAANFFTNARTVGGSTEGEVEVLLRVFDEPEGEFVIVASEAPVVTDGEVLVSDAVFIAVDEAGDFAALDDEDVAVVLDEEAEGFVEAGGERSPLFFLLVVDHDFASMKTGDKLAISIEVETADLGVEVFGEGDDFDVVVILPGELGEGEGGGEGEGK